MNEDRDIIFNRILSDSEAESKKEIRPENCMICGASAKPFCNSHSIPAQCLRAIAIEGNIQTFNGIVKLPPLKDEVGVNRAGTFRLICKECDNKIFKDYETFDNYTNPINTRLLNEIVLKNCLKFFSKKRLEEKKIPKMQSALKIPNVAGGILKTGKIDQKEWLHEFHNTLKLMKTNPSNYYRIIEFQKLPYTCPFSFQQSITMMSDLKGNLINNIYNEDKNYHLEDLQICIFPSNKYTIILVFIKRHYTRYNSFLKDYNRLELSSRLKLIIYIIFKYSEDFFYSPLINEIIDSDDLLVKAAHANDLCPSYFSMNEKIQKGLNSYTLEGYNKITNILDEKYSMQSLRNINDFK